MNRRDIIDLFLCSIVAISTITAVTLICWLYELNDLSSFMIALVAAIYSYGAIVAIAIHRVNTQKKVIK